MNYVEVICKLKPDVPEDAGEILIAVLAELGYESFEEATGEIRAYIDELLFDVESLYQFGEEYSSLVESTETKLILKENWNQVWESNFPMVTIANRCVVCAPFHTDVPDLEYRLIIMPQMSFGTGHHETTSLMLELMLDLDMEGKIVLDMGCGTGILAIMAHKKNAKSITAVDIDEWACTNAKENCERNNIADIEILRGDVSRLTAREFDIILANINRNILLSDIAAYAECLSPKGLLLLSGFYLADLPDITKEAQNNGFKYINHIEKKEWVAVVYGKE